VGELVLTGGASVGDQGPSQLAPAAPEKEAPPLDASAARPDSQDLSLAGEVVATDSADRPRLDHRTPADDNGMEQGPPTHVGGQLMGSAPAKEAAQLEASGDRFKPGLRSDPQVSEFRHPEADPLAVPSAAPGIGSADHVSATARTLPNQRPGSQDTALGSASSSPY
jgi:hypothetical protein